LSFEYCRTRVFPAHKIQHAEERNHQSAVRERPAGADKGAQVCIWEVVINWGMDWIWGLPLIILTVVIHAYGLGLLNKKVASRFASARRIHSLSLSSITLMGATALCTILLHAFEGALWAAAYRLLGALHDNKTAVLYSLGALTTYGHAPISLEPRWELMGVLEALDGLILFGLTTAFLFTVMEKAWPSNPGESR